jgi:hypothetical protein
MGRVPIRNPTSTQPIQMLSLRVVHRPRLFSVMLPRSISTLGLLLHLFKVRQFGFYRLFCSGGFFATKTESSPLSVYLFVLHLPVDFYCF